MSFGHIGTTTFHGATSGLDSIINPDDQSITLSLETATVGVREVIWTASASTDDRISTLEVDGDNMAVFTKLDSGGHEVSFPTLSATTTGQSFILEDTLGNLDTFALTSDQLVSYDGTNIVPISASTNIVISGSGGTISTSATPSFTSVTITSTPSASTDAATVAYVQSYVQGIAWQEPVIDQLATPPVGPTTGDRYIVTAVATGAWVGRETDIAQWNGSSWDFEVPSEGWAVWDETADALYVFNGSAWVLFGNVVTHNNLSGLQGGNGSTEYYHLDATDHGDLTNVNAQLANLWTTTSPTFTGVIIGTTTYDATSISSTATDFTYTITAKGTGTATLTNSGTGNTVISANSGNVNIDSTSGQINLLTAVVGSSTITANTSFITGTTTYDSIGITSSATPNFSYSVTPKGSGSFTVNERQNIVRSIGSSTTPNHLKVIQATNVANDVSGVLLSVDSGFAAKTGMVHVREATNGRGYMTFLNDNVDDTSDAALVDEAFRIPRGGNVHMYISNVSTVANAAPALFTAANFLGGYIQMTGAAAAVTPPTAAALVAAIPNPYIGMTFEVIIVHQTVDTRPFTTMNTNTGVNRLGRTTVGGGNLWTTLRIRLTNVTATTEAYTLYCLADGG